MVEHVVDLLGIQEKWQKKWEEAKIFEREPSSEKKFFITAAFPYPNSPQHIGHARTYTTTDIYARFKRMQGYNVLLPMAFHVTGTPIIAMADKLKEKDEGLIKIFEKIYGIPKKTWETLTEPEKLVMYFSKEIEQGMREMGFGIDWSRKFYTFDKEFNAFIQWQFQKLNEKKFITKGYRSGGIDYVTKPFDPDILLLKVKTFYRLSEQTQQLMALEKSLREEIEWRKEAESLLEQRVQERTRELHRSNQRLEQSNKELQQFVYVASHDLQEPLRKIQTFINISLERHLDDRNKSYG